VHGHDVHVLGPQIFEAAPDGLGARLAARDDARRLPQTEFFSEFEKSLYFRTGDDDDHFGDRRARLEAPERVDDDRRARELQKLLRRAPHTAAHPRAPPAGGDDGDIHKSSKFKVQSSKSEACTLL
jgi:hypothetical protein